eukprot:252856-Rhodomonas_salina.4
MDRTILDGIPAHIEHRQARQSRQDIWTSRDSVSVQVKLRQRAWSGKSPCQRCAEHRTADAADAT